MKDMALRNASCERYTAFGQKFRFFEKAESTIFDRGYYIIVLTLTDGLDKD